MVTRTGFEPINACVKGMCVNRFTNRPCILIESFSAQALLLYQNKNLMSTIILLNFKKIIKIKKNGLNKGFF